MPVNSRRPPISLPLTFQEGQLRLQPRHLLDDSPQQTPEQESALLSGVLQGWCHLSPCTPAADGSQACWSAGVRRGCSAMHKVTAWRHTVAGVRASCDLTLRVYRLSGGQLRQLRG